MSQVYNPRSIQKTPSTRRSRLGVIVDRQGRRFPWLAEQLDPPPTTSAISRWCSGEWRIPPARIPQLAKALGVSPEEIVE